MDEKVFFFNVMGFHRAHCRFWLAVLILFQTVAWKAATHRQLLGGNFCAPQPFSTIHSLKGQGSVYSWVFEPRANIIRHFKAPFPPSQYLVFFYSRSLSRHQSWTGGIKALHNEKLCKKSPTDFITGVILSWLKHRHSPNFAGLTQSVCFPCNMNNVETTFR